jgi:RNA polymerase sigma-70 factor (ECF subfamily)
MADDAALPERRVETASRDSRFAALVEQQSRFVFQVAWSVLRNAHDAEDVAQETFLKIYRADDWEGIANDRAYLARVAWRLAIDRLSARRPKLAIEERAPEPDPERAAIAADWNAIVQRLIDALPEELRQPLALSAIDELSSVEIGKAMGLPEGTVRTRIQRARRILKEKLTAMGAGKR